jgi:hypothetical protein
LVTAAIRPTDQNRTFLTAFLPPGVSVLIPHLPSAIPPFCVWLNSWRLWHRPAGPRQQGGRRTPDQPGPSRNCPTNFPRLCRGQVPPHDRRQPQPRGSSRPSAAALYAAKVADLQAALSDAAIRAEAAESLGSLIEKVVLTRCRPGWAGGGVAWGSRDDPDPDPRPLPARQTRPPRTNMVSEGFLSLVAGARWGIGE